MINIPHIDLRIWNPEHKAIEIIAELQKNGQAQIEMDHEGSDCETNGLYRLLNDICSSLNYDPSAISIHTCNQLERHDRHKIVKHPPLYIASGQMFARQHDLGNKNWHSMKHFGIFISRSSWQRLWMCSHIWNFHCDKTLLTYHFNYNSDYHKGHLGFNELAHEIGTKNAVEIAGEFIKTLPQTNNDVDTYPILTPAHFAISKLYNQFFVEIVCETFLAGQSFYPTEKTWRPFICRTPFLTLGPNNFLFNLRKLGFQTFNRWWDESYDQDGGKIAIENIQKTVDRLSNISARDLHAMHQDMKPVLDHNYNTFMNLTEQDFTQFWS